MDEQLILEMAMPFVKDGRLSYEQFDVLFDMLSRKEQYQVVEILFCHDIELFDEDVEDDEPLELSDEMAEDESNTIDTENIKNQISHLFVDQDALTDDVIPYSKYPSKQSNEILCHLIQQGYTQVAQDLCIKNSHLVYKYAKRYLQYYGNDLTIEDLVQAGNIGMIKAAHQFDLSRGLSFATYAVFWIKQEISRQIVDTGFTIRLPVHAMESINKVTRMETKLDQRAVSYEDRIQLIADELGWSEEKVRHCIKLRAQFLQTASLNLLVGEEGETELEELIPDPEADSVEDIVSRNLNREDIEQALHKSLTERETRVICMRFGLRGETPKSLVEIGEIFHVTRERIRQIEAKALKKLKSNRIIKNLRGGL